MRRILIGLLAFMVVSTGVATPPVATFTKPLVVQAVEYARLVVRYSTTTDVDNGKAKTVSLNLSGGKSEVRGDVYIVDELNRLAAEGWVVVNVTDQNLREIYLLKRG